MLPSFFISYKWSWNRREKKYKLLSLSLQVCTVNPGSFIRNGTAFPVWVSGSRSAFCDNFSVNERDLLTLRRAWAGKKWPLWSGDCLCRPVGDTDSAISVFMQFSESQTVWNCRKVNVEAQLRVCIYQSPHSRCAGPEPLSAVPLFMIWKFYASHLVLPDTLFYYF